ncbi:ZIP family metal transporter [Ferruginivarius sediminum]|uniref:ZIP family metal transporter n=1 Tax=Ferruginivarius sediminum TaxID=2661937 RepID=A0A369T8B6_9PROT|nr:ZIP family metal transporter [Ferruginivarius sediminum]RDD61518.1 ZIP family metal transporter [Ferruginivarius sediminum]
MIETSVWTVFIAALITAVATGLGALPFLFVRDMSRRWEAIGNAVAAGLMIAASLGLINEGVNIGPWRTLLGIGLGAVFMVYSHRLMDGHGHVSVGALTGADARKALMIVGVMTLHSAAEGIGVGVSFGGGEDLGILMTIAIAIHNVPEGLAISLVLVPRGVSVLMAAWWSVFSSLPQPLLAIPAFLFVAVFHPVLPVGLGLAAGAMLWMTMREMIPEALNEASRTAVFGAVGLSIVGMVALGLLVGM